MTKTDAEVQHDLMAELRWEPSVQAPQIGVSVHDGVATLSGQVDSCDQKWNAEHAAQRVVGVRALVHHVACGVSDLVCQCTDGLAPAR